MCFLENNDNFCNILHKFLVINVNLAYLLNYDAYVESCTICDYFKNRTDI